MGKEKRLFLLAVMTVMMSTAGFSETFIGSEKTSTEKEIIVDKKGQGHRVNSSDKTEDTTKVEINHKVEVKHEAGVGIYLNVSDLTGTKDKKEGKSNNEVTNKSEIIITSGTGVELYKKNDKENTGKNFFYNEGKIEIKEAAGAIGIAIKADGKVVNKTTGKIIATSGIGVNLNNITAEFINEGEIEVSKKGTEGIVVSTSNGTVNNNNKITVKENAKGIVLKGTKGNIINNNLIQVKSGIGISAETANLNDEMKQEGLVKNNGTIEVEGNSSQGMSATNGATIINEGSITVKGTTTKGMYASGSKSSAINRGSITVTGNGKELYGMYADERASLTNNGKNDKEKSLITVSGDKAVGMGAKGNDKKDDFKSNNHIKITNGDFGTISVSNKGIGMKLDKKSVGTNKGEIIATDDTGIGVQVGGGSYFINENEGKVEAKTAIKSLAGNSRVYLKNGSTVIGKILGHEDPTDMKKDGADILVLEGGDKNFKNLDVSAYEGIVARNGNVNIVDSTIGLQYNSKTQNNLSGSSKELDNIIGADKSKNKELSLKNTNLIVDLKNKTVEDISKTKEMEGVLKAEKVKFDDVKFAFSSTTGEDSFNISKIVEKITAGKLENKDLDYLKSSSTAIWNYSQNNGEWFANKRTFTEASKSQLKEFSSLIDSGALSEQADILQFLSQGEFDRGMTQLSGGVHGYIVDFAALNARTLTNTMKNRVLTRDYMRKRPLNSWTQDISYIDNNHRLGGLMNVDYTEKGVLGISEKQILPNGRLGLVYGGSKGNAKFEGGQNGSSTLDGAYFGGYYNHEFNNKWSLNSNANFVYTHNKVTRKINFEEGGKSVNETFKSAYPTYTVGMGSSLIYTVKDDLRNKAHFYAGVDVERIVVGNINENKNIPLADEKTGLAVKTTSYNARSYYSIVPSAGFMVQNTGYVFDRKYRIGADLNWETEVGNIKDGKRIKLTGLDKEYKIETSERENVFSYSLFGALDLTESLSLNARYTSMFSDEYDADMIGAGFEYKMDTMADNFFGTIAHKLENSRPFSDRWGGTLGIVMETDDSDDYTSYFEGVSSGDVATSMEYKPKITLSLNDKQSNWSYYFEAYHKTNNMFGSIKSDEKESHASRYHGEARWNDTYSKGSYGMSFGYRNENSDKSSYYATYGGRERVKTGTHELRITPSFTYDLGHGFTLGGKSAIVFMYKYEGDRAGQMDMNTESQIGLTYNGFMPRWSMTMNFYREDTWYDHSNRKPTWKKDEGIIGYNYAVPKRDQVNQLRPSITYYFGNGASFRFDARIALGNGSWADNIDGTNGSQSYETRYGFNYFYPVAPGLTVNIGGTFLNTKTKNKDHSKPTYGNITKGYNFRPNIGFYYSF